MSNVCFIILSVTIYISVAASLGIMGPYKARFLSATKDASISHPDANCTIRMKKINKVDTALFVTINILRDIGPIWLSIKLEKYGRGGYKNWLTDGDLRGVACDNFFFKKMVDNSGSGEKHLSEDCVALKGKVEVKNISLDEEMHKIKSFVTYGQFRITSTLSEEDETPLVAMALEIIFEPL